MWKYSLYVKMMQINIQSDSSKIPHIVQLYEEVWTNTCYANNLIISAASVICKGNFNKLTWQLSEYHWLKVQVTHRYEHKYQVKKETKISNKSSWKLTCIKDTIVHFVVL